MRCHTSMAGLGASAEISLRMLLLFDASSRD